LGCDVVPVGVAADDHVDVVVVDEVEEWLAVEVGCGDEAVGGGVVAGVVVEDHEGEGCLGVCL